MRCFAALTAALLGACGGDGGGEGTRVDPIVDAGPRADRPPPAPLEDAFRPLIVASVPDARPPAGDARSPEADAAPDATADAAGPDAGPDAAPGPALGPPGALAAGAAPLRSARYRLYAIAGPAAAAGTTLTSERFRLHSGAVVWRAAPSAPPEADP